LIALGVSSIGRIGATYSQNAKTLEECYDYLVDFKSCFGTELTALKTLTEPGLVLVDDNGIQVTSMGWFFERVGAMVCERYLQTDRTRARLSKII